MPETNLTKLEDVPLTYFNMYIHIGVFEVHYILNTTGENSITPLRHTNIEIEIHQLKVFNASHNTNIHTYYYTMIIESKYNFN